MPYILTLIFELGALPCSSRLGLKESKALEEGPGKGFGVLRLGNSCLLCWARNVDVIHREDNQRLTPPLKLHHEFLESPRKMVFRGFQVKIHQTWANNRSNSGNGSLLPMEDDPTDQFST